jgi:hypothetical protein
MLGIEFNVEQDNVINAKPGQPAYVSGYHLYYELGTFWSQQNKNFELTNENGIMKVAMSPEQALLFYLTCPQYTNLLQPV